MDHTHELSCQAHTRSLHWMPRWASV